jgi:predicted dehydrogenase
LVTLGIIGAGIIGKVHAAIAADLPECRLVGICDVNRLAYRSILSKKLRRIKSGGRLP